MRLFRFLVNLYKTKWHQRTALTRLGSLVFICLLLRIQCFFGSFIADDYLHLANARSLSQTGWSGIFHAYELKASDLGILWYTPQDIAIHFLRPLSTALFIMDYRLWGLCPFGFHLTNLLLHLIVIFLCYSLSSWIFNDKNKGWLAALIFLSHPALTEAVNWVSARTELLMTVFILSALLCGRKAFEMIDHIRASLVNRRSQLMSIVFWFFLSEIFFTLALFSKESAIIFPLLLILVWVLRNGTWRAAISQQSLVSILYLIPVGFYWSLRSQVMPLVEKFPPAYFIPITNPAFIVSYVRKFVLYITHYLFLNPVDAYLARSLYESQPWVITILLVASGATIWFIHRKVLRNSIFRYAFLWVLIGLAPSALVFLGKRFLYLPLVGFALWATEVYDLVNLEQLKLHIGKHTIDGASLLKKIFIMYLVVNYIIDWGAIKNSRDIGKTIEQVYQLLPDIQYPAQIHFGTLWFPLAIGVDHALRLRYDNDAITTVAWSVFFHSLTPEKPIVTSLDEAKFRLAIPHDDLLREDCARFYLWGESPPKENEYQFNQYSIKAHRTTTQTIDALEVSLHGSKTAHQYVLTFEGERLVRVYP